ncbi:CHAD domain-containing protein [Microbacterium sulfonylureivorans]|uniref:CHAD domain-containing protein n=1 Tax=Microbacterium sulfonylureivorans TaxID=2486854 RepID=UPI0013DF557A|nr:CHAD domain-containing protein [Microbacterium sulfonylureivorans]
MSELSAEGFITDALRELVRQFDETEQAALAAEPDGVHQHRTVVRRLRGVLRVFGYLYDPHAVGRVRDDLKQWGMALGVVRDHEVAAELARTLIAEIADPHVDHAVLRLVDPDRDAAVAAQRRLVAIHDLDRHREGRAFLHAFAEDPPVSPRAAEPVSGLRRPLLREGRRALRSAGRMSTSLRSHHELRKSARRLRYCVEAVTAGSPDLFGQPLRRIGEAAHRIQSSLGDHRDAHLFLTRIERTRVHAGRAGEDTRVYDELEAAAARTASDRLRELPKERKRLRSAVAALKDGTGRKASIE